MSALFQDESQQTFKLPTEVWRTILDFCVDQDQDFSTASRKVIIFVLSVLSKAFHNLTRKQTLPKSSFGDSVIPAFCCFRGYASLLQYAIDHGAKPRRRDGTEAIIEGHLDCLKVLEKSGSWKLDDDELHDAISCGQMHITQYLLSKGITLTQDALPLAVSSGQLEMVTLCQSSFVIDSYDGLGLPAVKSGSLAMVKFIEQYTPLKQSDLVGAALHGSIEIVQYYLDKGFNVDDAKLCTTAAYPNHREFLKFVIKRGAPFSIAVMRFAASRNYVDLLQEMQAKGCAWEISVVNQAASHGHLEALKFLVDNGCPTTAPLKPQPLNSLGQGGFSFGFDSDAETTVVAAQNGHLSCLQYLMERGAPWPKDIIQKSIVYQNKNQLGIVAYLHSQGCPWNASVTGSAAKIHNLELLKYLHENNCPWDATTCAVAAEHALRVHCLKYALDNGCPWDHRTMNNAATSGSLDTLKLVFEKGIPWTDDTCTHLMKKGTLEMLQFAHENGAPWTPRTLTSGLESLLANLKCFKYAIENGCPWDSQVALEVATRFRHKEIVQWILKQRTNDEIDLNLIN